MRYEYAFKYAIRICHLNMKAQLNMQHKYEYGSEYDIWIWIWICHLNMNMNMASEYEYEYAIWMWIWIRIWIWIWILIWICHIRMAYSYDRCQMAFSAGIFRCMLVSHCPTYSDQFGIFKWQIACADDRFIFRWHIQIHMNMNVAY